MIEASTDALKLFLPIVVDEKRGVDFSASAATNSSRTLLEFLLLPATGGSFLLASTSSSASFRAGLQGLPISRPIWRFGRLVLGTLSRVGLHRFLGLKKVQVSVEMALDTDPIDFSLQSGVPGGGQKLIVREHGPNGHLEAFWKVGRSGLPAHLVQAECAALKWLANHKQGAPLSPVLLSSGVDDRRAWLRMTAIQGAAVPAESAELVSEFTARLASLESCSSTIESSAWLQRMEHRLGEIEGASPSVASLCRKALQWLCETAGDGTFHFHPAHGDLTPWNALARSGQLFAFDWEFFQVAAPAGFDHFHWTLQVAILTRRATASQVRGQLQKSFEHLCGADAADGERYLAMYLVDALSREEHVFLSGKPNFPQVAWLLECRTQLLEQVIG